MWGERFVQDLDHVFRFLADKVVLKNVNESEVSIWVQNFIERSKIEDLKKKIGIFPGNDLESLWYGFSEV